MNNLFILKLQKKFSNFFNNLSYFEDFLIGNKKKFLPKSNSKHIFLSGMPRSGTTIITHILSNFEDVGTYNYSDLPFFKIPFFSARLRRANMTILSYKTCYPFRQIPFDPLSTFKRRFCDVLVENMTSFCMRKLNQNHVTHDPSRSCEMKQKTVARCSQNLPQGLLKFYDFR